MLNPDVWTSGNQEAFIWCLACYEWPKTMASRTRIMMHSFGLSFTSAPRKTPRSVGRGKWCRWMWHSASVVFSQAKGAELPQMKPHCMESEGITSIHKELSKNWVLHFLWARRKSQWDELLLLLLLRTINKEEIRGRLNSMVHFRTCGSHPVCYPKHIHYHF